MMNERQLSVAKRAFEKALGSIQQSSTEHPQTTDAQVGQLVISLSLGYKDCDSQTVCGFSIDLSKVGLEAPVPEPVAVTFWERLLKDDA